MLGLGGAAGNAGKRQHLGPPTGYARWPGPGQDGARLQQQAEQMKLQGEERQIRLAALGGRPWDSPWESSGEI